MATPVSPRHPRITRDYLICQGQPVVRGLCHPVWQVLEWLANRSEAAILAEHEDLESADFPACVAYAAMLLKKISDTLASDGLTDEERAAGKVRRSVSKAELQAHLIQLGKLPPNAVKVE